MIKRKIQLGAINYSSSSECPTQVLQKNFIISGGDSDDHCNAVYSYIENIIGKCPLIVLYSGHTELPALVNNMWHEMEITTPLWSIDKDSMDFEPFYGMDRNNILTVLREIAKKNNYVVKPCFDKVVDAHLSICKYSNLDVCLSSFSYISSFKDMKIFRENIMSLECEQNESLSICAGLGLGDDENDQLDLFRSVIGIMEYEASYNGWYPDDVKCVNIGKAIEDTGTLLFSVDDFHKDNLIPYFLQELSSGKKEYVLILDGVTINESFVNYLSRQRISSGIGLIAEDVTALFEQDKEKKIKYLSSKIDTYVLFSHRSSYSAELFSEIIGKSDQIRKEFSVGKSREDFHIWGSKTTTASEKIENKYRVMPEDITGLSDGQSIVFDTRTSSVIFHY